MSSNFLVAKAMLFLDAAPPIAKGSNTSDGTRWYHRQADLYRYTVDDFRKGDVNIKGSPMKIHACISGEDLHAW